MDIHSPRGLVPGVKDAAAPDADVGGLLRGIDAALYYGATFDINGFAGGGGNVFFSNGSCFEIQHVRVVLVRLAALDWIDKNEKAFLFVAVKFHNYLVVRLESESCLTVNNLAINVFRNRTDYGGTYLLAPGTYLNGNLPFSTKNTDIMLNGFKNSGGTAFNIDRKPA